MIFDSRTYSVLIVSASEKMASQISSVLSSSSCYPVITVSSISAAQRETLDRSYDFIIINSPIRDETGVRFALDMNEKAGTVCLMLIKAEDFEDLDAVLTPEGIFTLMKPISNQAFQLSVHWLKTARERMRKADKKAVTLEDRMEEIRIINRAKWVLIEKEGMTESEAHRFLEKQAMDTCRTKLETAKMIIEKQG